MEALRKQIDLAPMVRVNRIVRKDRKLLLPPVKRHIDNVFQEVRRTRREVGNWVYSRIYAGVR